VAPKPPINLNAELIYSQKSAVTPLLSDGLMVADVFWPYLKYGVLAVCFSKRWRDARPLPAKLCQSRYERGVEYAKKFMRSVQVEMDFSRLASARVEA